MPSGYIPILIFLVIALLPSSLYSRAVISADGPSLACAMMAVALMLRGVTSPAADRPWQQSLWLALGALSKPPQLALVLLEMMKRPAREWPRHWKSAAVVVLPSFVLAVAWTIAAGADDSRIRLSSANMPWGAARNSPVPTGVGKEFE